MPLPCDRAQDVLASGAQCKLPGGVVVDIGLAQPDQANAAADLIYQADPVRFDYVLGHRALAMIAACWREDRNLYSHRLARVATCGRELVGLEMGFTSGEFPMLRSNTRHWFMTFGQQAWQRFEQASMLLPSVPHGAYYLQFLAVAERFRGHGIGSRLFLSSVGRARKDRCRAIHLDTAAASRAATFFGRLGMQVACQSKLRCDGGFDENLRFTTALSDVPSPAAARPDPAERSTPWHLAPAM